MKQYRKLFVVALFFFIMLLVYPNTAQAKTYTYKRTYCIGQVISPRVSKVLTSSIASKANWKSSNTNIATVSKKGVITIKKRGSVNVTATYNKNTIVFNITAGDYWIPVSNKKSGTGNFSFVITKVSPKTFVIQVKNKNKTKKSIKFDYFKIGSKSYYTTMDKVAIGAGDTKTITLTYGKNFKKLIDLKKQVAIHFHYYYYS